MKSSRSTRQAYGGGLDRRNDRRGGKRQGSEKAKLDRKSSRGMIYENEELRLRTININAEVERGQSDIKRLRRENEQLRREIWTLRDECDRLNKRFKAKLIDHEHGGACGSARCSGESCNVRGSNGAGGVCDSHSNSEDSDSCDTCRAAEYDDDVCSDDCCLNGTCQQAGDYSGNNAATAATTLPSGSKGDGAAASSSSGANNSAAAGTSVDHLSVVSEETLSNADVQAGGVSQAMPLPPLPPLVMPSHTESMTTPFIGPLTPLTPVEKVANQLNDMQAVVPPLSYFESVLQQHMVPTSVGTTSEAASVEARTRQTNGWDYNLESPFAQRKFPSSASRGATASLQAVAVNGATAAATAAAAAAIAPVTLTTFVPTPQQPPPPQPPSLPIIKLPEKDAAAKGASNGNKSSALPAIETVAITTMPTNAISASATAAAVAAAAAANTTTTTSGAGSPKHFFAPLKPRLKLNTSLANKNLIAASVPAVPPLFPASTITSPNSTQQQQQSSTQAYNPPDLFVTNGLASPYHRQALPSGQSAAVLPPQLPQRTVSQSSSQADSVNLKSILNEIETISEDILAIQMEKAKSRENLSETSTFGKPLQTEDKTKKPYRSEMNLLLTYDGAGSNPTITPANAVTNSQISNTVAGAKQTERDQSESPSVSVPDPMIPFPANRTYIGFEQFDSAATMGTPVGGIGGGGGIQKSPLPPPIIAGETRAQITLKSPPTPPARHRQLPPNGIATTTAQLNLRTDAQARAGLAPNKSHLYTAIANAAAKRAQFRANTAASNSLNAEMEQQQMTGASQPSLQISPNRVDSMNTTNELPGTMSDAAKKKARRVSIVCGDENAATPTSVGSLEPLPPSSVYIDASSTRSQAQNAQSTLSLPSITLPPGSVATALTITPAITTASCTDLSAASALQNPAALRCLRQHLSHSTPNSPHSSRRRRSNSNTMASTQNTPEHQASGDGQQRKSSQDSTDALSSAVALAAAGGRSRCSRRHSEGTIAGSTTGAATANGGAQQQQQQQRISGTSSGHHHHHHRHHHHHHHNHNQPHHSSLLCGSNPHHSHHSHQDSTHETGTSLSDHDRMSNSLASSRESSTTFSMRSQRRKISISSHTGGKIPWCGCWGNGCL